MKKYLTLLLGMLLFVQNTVVCLAEEPLNLSAETAIIMEAETGTILYEKEADKALPPASVTRALCFAPPALVYPSPPIR